MIDWSKPKKVRSTAAHNQMFSSDSGVPGTFVPNMSEEDKLKWKGKHINKGKDNARVELRKSFSFDGEYANVLLVVEKGEHHPYIKLSTNGKVAMSFSEWGELNLVVQEASTVVMNPE